MRLHDRFTAAAHAWPARTALEQGDRRLTYADAAARVGGAARLLQDRLQPGARIALHLSKSPEAILMMLASLRAGLTYVPIDPAAPPERTRFILRDSGATALVVDSRTAQSWSPEVVAGLPLVAGPDGSWAGCAELVALEQLLSPTACPAPGRATGGQDPAYLLYTSGSTGTPKGVVITHANAEAFVDWATGHARLAPGDRVAVHAPLHFDLPVFDVYAGLGSGATVCPVDERTVLFPQALLRFLQERRISVLYAVPSALIALLHRSTLAADGLPALRLLLYAGEEFHPKPLRQLMGALPGTEVHNLYGPIETNVVTALRVGPEHLQLARIPIGQAVAGARVFLVDGGELVTQADRPGELVVSGPSVTPGYLNRPDLTAQARLVIQHEGRRWDCHRTGDYASWGDDGTLHFLGRRDGMVKTRGYRVELGEVEAALVRHPQVREAAVVAVAHPEHSALLHGFAVVDDTHPVTGADLVRWCTRTLPAYMAPQSVTVAVDFPRTSTGKLARRELAAQLPATGGAR